MTTLPHANTRNRNKTGNLRIPIKFSDGFPWAYSVATKAKAAAATKAAAVSPPEIPEAL